MVPGLVRGEDGQVTGTSPTLGPHLTLMARSWGHIELTADNRLNARRLRFVEEFNGPVHVAVIGHGDSWLPKLSRVRYNFFKLVSPIEEAVLGVKMEVNELRHVASKERKRR
jgi:hypothetical protein